MNKNTTLIAVAILLLAAVGFFVLRPSKQQTTPSQPTQQEAQTQDSAFETTGADSETPDDEETAMKADDATTGEIQDIQVTARQWEFDPNPIRVKVGIPVRLTVASIDVTHGFKIPEFDIDKRLEPNKAVVVEFTPDKKGTFPFFCSVLCGSGHTDMKGSIIVE